MAVRFALLLVLLLSPGMAFAATGGGISVTVTVQQTLAGVRVDPPRRGKSGRPGRTVTHTFTVTNTSNGTDQFQLAASSSQGWAINLPGGNLTRLLTAGKGGHSRAKVKVEVTIDPAATDGTVDTLTLTATSQLDPTVSAQASVTTTVNQVVGVTVDPPRRGKFGRPGRTRTYRFTVVNTGSGVDQFQLAASSSQGWSINLPSGNLTRPLRAGKGGRSRAKVKVEVTIDPAATDGMVDTLTLTATPQLDPTVSAQASVTTTVVVRGRKP